MKRYWLLSLLWITVSGLPLAAQAKLHPVRPDRNETSVLLISDRTEFSVDKSFQNKLIVGFPSDDRVAFIPQTGAQIVMLWLRIQNVSQRPLAVDITKFTSTDDEGRTSPPLTADQAYTLFAAGSGGSLGSKALRGISLGRVGSRTDDEDLKENLQRYSLQSDTLPPGAVRDGLIFFEAPAKKQFSVSVSLGELWSRPLVFSTEKQK